MLSEKHLKRVHLYTQALPIKWIVLLAFVILLTACGFRLRGSAGSIEPLPFQSIYVSIPANTAFGSDLRRFIASSSPNTLILNDASVPADVILQQVSENRTAREISLNAQGRVEEYELTLTYTFRLVTPTGEVVLPDTTLRARRTLPFDDRVVQAKEAEEASLFKQMQAGLVSRILRRISAPDVTQAYNELERNDQP